MEEQILEVEVRPEILVVRRGETRGKEQERELVRVRPIETLTAPVSVIGGEHDQGVVELVPLAQMTNDLVEIGRVVVGVGPAGRFVVLGVMTPDELLVQKDVRVLVDEVEDFG